MKAAKKAIKAAKLNYAEVKEKYAADKGKCDSSVVKNVKKE